MLNNYPYIKESKKSKFSCSYANQISVGDEVLGLGSNELTPVKVVKVSSSQMQGNHHCRLFLTLLDLCSIVFSST